MLVAEPAGIPRPGIRDVSRAAGRWRRSGLIGDNQSPSSKRGPESVRNLAGIGPKSGRNRAGIGPKSGRNRGGMESEGKALGDGEAMLRILIIASGLEERGGCRGRGRMIELCAEGEREAANVAGTANLAA